MYYSTDIVNSNSYHLKRRLLLNRNTLTNYVDYRYGFNNMERDDEIKGGGNSYDFGARMLDARLGRWLSIDALASKYPGNSPYQYVASSPIMNKEVDGNDYIVSVDHKAKTITIKAVYYTEAGDEKSYHTALKGTELWNKQSGKFNYILGKGKNKVKYEIIFDIKVLELTEGEKLSSKTANKAGDPTPVFDESGKQIGTKYNTIPKDTEANTLEVMSVPEFMKERNSRDASVHATGLTADGNKIFLPDNKLGTSALVTAHEIGHSLGLEHWAGTLMNTTVSDSKKITGAMEKAIVGNSGVTNNYIKDGAIPVKRELVETNKEDKPKDFDSGKVKRNKQK